MFGLSPLCCGGSCLCWTLMCASLVQPVSSFPLTHFPLLLNQADYQSSNLGISGKRVSVFCIGTLTCKLENGQAVRGEGHLKCAAREGCWKKADFVWKINFNFVEPHNPFLLHGVGRALDA